MRYIQKICDRCERIWGLEFGDCWRLNDKQRKQFEKENGRESGYCYCGEYLYKRK